MSKKLLEEISKSLQDYQTYIAKSAGALADALEGVAELCAGHPVAEPEPEDNIEDAEIVEQSDDDMFGDDDEEETAPSNKKVTKKKATKKKAAAKRKITQKEMIAIARRVVDEVDNGNKELKAAMGQVDPNAKLLKDIPAGKYLELVEALEPLLDDEE